MDTLEDINPQRPIWIYPCRDDTDRSTIDVVVELDRLCVQGDDVGRFLAWAQTVTWRHHFESDLQCVSEDGITKEPLLSTWLPLQTLRGAFCAGGRSCQDASTQQLMERLQEETKAWRSHEVDLVEIDGYRIRSRSPMPAVVA